MNAQNSVNPFEGSERSKGKHFNVVTHLFLLPYPMPYCLIFLNCISYVSMVEKTGREYRAMHKLGVNSTFSGPVFSGLSPQI